jgi:hypothetical protein
MEVRMTNKNNYRLIGIFIFFVATTVAFSQTVSQQGAPPMPFGSQAPQLPDFTKNVIIGQLKNVEKTKLTLSRPDGVEQSVALDATTKFVGDHGDAITLADFKAGDKVAVTGTLKDGVLVAAQLAKVPSGPGTPPALPPLPNPGSN